MTRLHGTEIVTAAQMRAIESAAMGSGAVTGLQLMTRAGAAVAGLIRLRWPRPGRVTVLCGPGANGGDGFVIARLLAGAGWTVRLLGADPAPGTDAAAARAAWRGPVLPPTRDAFDAGSRPDLCVDAIFGTGLSRPPEGEVAALLQRLWDPDLRGRLVAVDAPSGLCLDSGVLLGQGRGALPAGAARAALTVAFDSPKPGHLLEHGPLVCGDLVIADIGLAEVRPDGRSQTVAIGPGFARPDPFEGDWLRKTHLAQGHKYTHGAALIVAGGPGHGGAARLAARAALRVGAGLVTVCPPAEALSEHTLPPDALMRRAIGTGADLTAALQDPRPLALCMGPGCGLDRAAALLPAALAAGRPLVLDADALTALARSPAPPLPPDCVLTPHAGEFARLFPDLASALKEDGRSTPCLSRAEAARQAAQRIGAVLVLKGPDTVIAAPGGQVAIHSDMGLPWLATAGSGDVLAGLITGLLARGLPGFEAACLGIRLHAAAARRHGPGLIADDLIDQLPALIGAWLP